MLHIYTNSNFFYFLFTLIIISLILCYIILSFKYLLRSRSQSINTNNKNTPFESGINPVGLSKSYIDNKFYLISIMFIIFDVECLYLYIWAANAINLGWNIFYYMLLFVATILFGLIYITHNNMFKFNKR
ncbi:MAG: NADH-quinone oxidoreductase subunit A [Candidatus Lightella neohaematopini]|nr:NADH-quinone oxidoreductase subunit A [Candidatus Lightella neohaematopini]